MEKKCQHWINDDFEECGKPAVAVVNTTRNKLMQSLQVSGENGRQLGAGSGSLWITVCDSHRWEYPDYDGFVLDEAAQ